MGRVRKAKRGPVAASRKRAAASSPLIVDLLLELYNTMGDTGIALGATAKQQRQALELALKKPPRRRPSQVVLKNDMALGQMLSVWRKDAVYRQTDGSPKILPIQGRGVSLAHLAQHCGLKLPIEQIVELLCAQSEVIKLKRGKVALVGNPAHIVDDKTVKSLAWFTTQIRHIAETNVHNFRLPLKKRAEGRFDRQIWGMLTKSEFKGFARDIRPVLQEAANHVETKIDGSDNPRSQGKKRVCGIGLYVFYEDDDGD